MKKGFLFGSGPSKSEKSSSTTTKEQNNSNTGVEKISNAKSSQEKSQTEEMPFISPKGKTDSGLTFNEVQQAMSEAKGLLDNQGEGKTK